MTYRDKFNASQNKAHYQNIATKILREMTALRASVETSLNTPRRWVWELLQNAKDVHRGSGVKIQITDITKDGKEYLAFQHDGLPFTADNIRFLIEQISSKDREKDDEGRRKETGKFGTGFLTTHMLSEKVKVSGVAKEEGLEYRKFSFTLDRTGFELHEIIAAVEKSKSEIEDIDTFPTYLDYKPTDFNTTFIYLLEDNISRQVKNQGINDLNINLPYTLCFIKEIKTVTLKPEIKTYQIDSEEVIDEDLNVTRKVVKITEKGKPTQSLNFVILQKGLTTIAIPIEVKGESTFILPIGLNVPKIFCDFPLIGTESFPFPCVINNPNFNPTDPRDGIFLTDSTRVNPLTDENKRIVEEAVELYFDLLDFAIEKNWGNLHLLAKLGNLTEPILSNTSPTWYVREIQKPIREKLAHSDVVRNAEGNLCSILNEANKEHVWFPSGGSKDIREFTWDLAQLWFPHVLPQKEDVEFWNQTIWPECGKLTLLQFASFVEHYKTLEDFAAILKDTDPVEWLNLFYELLSKDKSQFVTIMDAKAIVPDQNGNLGKKSHLKKQSTEIPELFKDILSLLGSDIREKLVNENITLDFEEHDNYSLTDAIKAITTEVIEKTNDREISQNYRPAFKLLLKYFSENPSVAKSQFPAIYSKKHLLYDDDEIMNNIDRAEELNDLLSVFQVSSADELRKKFERLGSDKPSLLPITEEILVAMGITNIEEWEDAMRDTDLKALFDHRSVPSKEMFVLAHAHIDRARTRVINHLKTLVDDYNLDELDIHTAPTILAGVYKHERPVKIVFRPAYSKEVIVYYGAEKDTLDFADAELWVDDGKDVWQVSLGHILKKNNIKKFPI